MSQPRNQDPSDETVDQELAALGVEHKLRRTLSAPSVVLMGLAWVSPTLTVVLITGGVFAVGGVFGLDAGLIMIPVTLCICLCMAELASKYPLAGAMYSLVRYSLPGPAAILALFACIVFLAAALAAFGIGVGLFVTDLIPAIHLSDKLFAIILLGGVTIIALARVEVGGWVTKVLVVVEICALGIITFAGIIKHHQNFLTLVAHPTAPSVGGHMLPITGAVALATLAPAFNLVFGYDASLSFAEELSDEHPKALARVIIIAGLSAAFLIVIPMAAILVAATSLPHFFASPVPATYSVRQALGGWGGDLIDIGAIIASVAVTLAGVMYLGRVLYSSGRDGVWPGALGRRIGSLNRFSAPGIAVAIVGGGSIILAVAFNLTFLLIFTGTLITLVVFMVAVGSVVNHIVDREHPSPYKMPLWPLPALVVIAAGGIALVKQETKYIIAGLILVAISVAYWALSRLWDKDWSWGTSGYASADKSAAREDQGTGAI